MTLACYRKMQLIRAEEDPMRKSVALTISVCAMLMTGERRNGPIRSALDQEL